MNADGVLWLICTVLCVLIFTGLGLYARFSDRPVAFYTGTVIKPETIRDIRAYNRAVSRMWFGYALPYALSGGVYFINVWAGVSLLVGASTIGVIIVILVWEKIYRKYRVR